MTYASIYEDPKAFYGEAFYEYLCAPWTVVDISEWYQPEMGH